jgi:hypothetical protein
MFLESASNKRMSFDLEDKDEKEKRSETDLLKMSFQSVRKRRTDTICKEVKKNLF